MLFGYFWSKGEVWGRGITKSVAMTPFPSCSRSPSLLSSCSTNHSVQGRMGILASRAAGMVNGGGLRVKSRNRVLLSGFVNEMPRTVRQGSIDSLFTACIDSDMTVRSGLPCILAVEAIEAPAPASPSSCSSSEAVAAAVDEHGMRLASGRVLVK